MTNSTFGISACKVQNVIIIISQCVLPSKAAASDFSCSRSRMRKHMAEHNSNINMNPDSLLSQRETERLRSQAAILQTCKKQVTMLISHLSRQSCNQYF